MQGNKISFFLAISAGILGVVQGMINAHIGKLQGQYVMILGVSAVQLLLASFLLWNVKSVSPLQINLIAWMIAAGVMGVGIMFGVSYASGRVGTLPVFVLIIVGQILASAVIDHFGLLGLPQNPISLTKLASILIILAGVLCLVLSSTNNSI